MKKYFSLLAMLMFVVPAFGDEDDVQVETFQHYLKLANEGDYRAEFFIARWYEIGKGTRKDPEKALYWYRKGAEKGHPLAILKVQEWREAQDKLKADKNRNSTALAASAAKAIESFERTEKAKAPKLRVRTDVAVAPAPSTVAKATPKLEPAPLKSAPVKIIPALLAGNWRTSVGPAEFLPSARTACLQSDLAEITCFSQESTRASGGAALTYNVKATLSGFNDEDGMFGVHYIYNVIQVARSDSRSDIHKDAETIKAEIGWQEPGYRSQCHVDDERLISCRSGSKKTGYRFTRE